jgi:hypothetical protein
VHVIFLDQSSFDGSALHHLHQRDKKRKTAERIDETVQLVGRLEDCFPSPKHFGKRPCCVIAANGKLLSYTGQ